MGVKAGSYFASLTILLLLFGCVTLSAEEQPQADEVVVKEIDPTSLNAEEDPNLLIPYIPPSTEKLHPTLRTTVGGTRDTTVACTTQIILLTPNHVGFTTKAQPALFFHVNEKFANRLIFTVQDIASANVLIESEIKGEITDGINQLLLNDYGVALETDKTYKWTVASNHCSLLASSFIQRVSDQHEKSSCWYDLLQAIYTQHKSPLQERDFLNLLSQIKIQLE